MIVPKLLVGLHRAGIEHGVVLMDTPQNNVFMLAEDSINSDWIVVRNPEFGLPSKEGWCILAGIRNGRRVEPIPLVDVHPAPENLQELLFYLFAQQNNEAVATVCREYPLSICIKFKTWLTVCQRCGAYYTRWKYAQQSRI